jgi:dihydrofolate synthase/folylpolyglutamate synthase
MNYEESLNFIHSERWLGPKRPLSCTRKLLDALGAPDRKMKIIHVAGTNGKGSVCACMESILRHSGYKTGLFTSPYITRFNERIKVNGEDISDEELAELVTELEPYIDACEEHPKEFEIVTVLGLMYFAKMNCDVAVVEVGMGGEFDYTNVIDTPDAAVITAIGLDHTKQLGSTLTEIASVKAGIIKEGGDVIIYGGDDSVNKVFSDRCREKSASFHLTPLNDVKLISSDFVSCTFDFKDYKNIRIPLAGTYQPYNAALAITTAEILQNKGYSITRESIISGIENVTWKGRFELLRENPNFILDGAHNPHAVKATVESLREKLKGEKVIFVTGVMADKDINTMIDLLLPISKCFITIPIDYPRAMKPQEYAELLKNHGADVVVADTVKSGVDMAIALAGKEGTVCALGSLYLSQSVREAVAETEK